VVRQQRRTGIQLLEGEGVTQHVPVASSRDTLKSIRDCQRLTFSTPTAIINS
jgi:hypothetical protein